MDQSKHSIEIIKNSILKGDNWISLSRFHTNNEFIPWRESPSEKYESNDFK